MREIESTGKLSLVNFWVARVRRIFPASFVVIVATEADYVAVFNEVLDSGTPVATFRDNPSLDEATQDCVRFNFSDPRLCKLTPGVAFRTDDPATNAATKLGMHIIDMSAVFCHDNVCPLAIGRLNVYRDDDHVNREFNETLAPLIAADFAGARLIRTE